MLVYLGKRCVSTVEEGRSPRYTYCILPQASLFSIPVLSVDDDYSPLFFDGIAVRKIANFLVHFDLLWSRNSIRMVVVGKTREGEEQVQEYEIDRSEFMQNRLQRELEGIDKNIVAILMTEGLPSPPEEEKVWVLQTPFGNYKLTYNPDTKEAVLTFKGKELKRLQNCEKGFVLPAFDGRQFVFKVCCAGQSASIPLIMYREGENVGFDDVLCRAEWHKDVMLIHRKLFEGLWSRTKTYIWNQKKETELLLGFSTANESAKAI